MVQGKDYLCGHRYSQFNSAVHWLRANQVIAGSVLGLILGQLVLRLPPSLVLATMAGSCLLAFIALKPRTGLLLIATVILTFTLIERWSLIASTGVGRLYVTDLLLLLLGAVLATNLAGRDFR